MSTLSVLTTVDQLSRIEALELLAKHGIYPPGAFQAEPDALREIVRRYHREGLIPDHSIMEYAL